MGVKIRVNKGIVYLVTYDNGVTHEQSTGLHVTDNKALNREVMKLAETLRVKKEMDLVMRRNGLQTEESSDTLYDYMKGICETDTGGSQNMKRILPYLERFGAKDVLLRNVTPKWFENFQEKMVYDSGLSSAHSQEKYCQYVRQGLKKAARDGLIQQDPASGIKHIRTPDSKKEFLTEDEVRALVVTEYHNQMKPELQSDIRRAFLFGCLTGFRVSDLTQLKWEDVDVEKKVIIKKQKKTKRIVSVPLSNEAWLLIDDGKKHMPTEIIFRHLSESHSSTNRYIKGWAKAAGINKNVSWHTARHTDATLLIESGADLYTVQRLLGHSQIKTTMQYAVVSDKKKQEAVASLPSIGLSDK